MVHRLEGQLLAAPGEGRDDLGQRRAGAGGDDELGRLVERDAGERRRRQGRLRLRRPADRLLGAAAGDGERRAPRRRLGDHGRGFLLGGGR